MQNYILTTTIASFTNITLGVGIISIYKHTDYRKLKTIQNAQVPNSSIYCLNNSKIKHYFGLEIVKLNRKNT